MVRTKSSVLDEIQSLSLPQYKHISCWYAYDRLVIINGLQRNSATKAIRISVLSWQFNHPNLFGAPMYASWPSRRLEAGFKRRTPMKSSLVQYRKRTSKSLLPPLMRCILLKLRFVIASGRHKPDDKWTSARCTRVQVSYRIWQYTQPLLQDCKECTKSIHSWADLRSGQITIS